MWVDGTKADAGRALELADFDRVTGSSRSRLEGREDSSDGLEETGNWEIFSDDGFGLGSCLKIGVVCEGTLPWPVDTLSLSAVHC